VQATAPSDTFPRMAAAAPAPAPVDRLGEYVKVINVAASFLGSVLLSNVMNPSSQWKGCPAPVYGAWATLCAVGFAMAFLTVVFSAVRVARQNNETTFFRGANVTFTVALGCAAAAVSLSMWCLHGPPEANVGPFVAATIAVGISASIVIVGTILSLNF
jgi:hypothetical protein